MAVYNSPLSISSLDMNFVKRSKASEFPKNIYKKEPFNPSKCQPCQYVCNDYPRDKSIDYFFPTERSVHPPHFSRFGYSWCGNGYCIANHPGRYNTAPPFRWQTTEPQNMAPEKFYHGKYADTNYSSSPAYNNSFRSRNGLDVDRYF